MRSMVDVSHDFLKPVMHRDAVMIDATLGTGRDAAFFLKKARKVIAYEIQPETAARTAKQLKDDRLEIRVQSHAHIGDLDLEADGIIFNFGWDPAGDHSRTTEAVESLMAVKAALRKLRRKGRMALVFYPHAHGRKEARLILDWLETLDHRVYPCEKVQLINSPNSPFCVLIERMKTSDSPETE